MIPTLSSSHFATLYCHLLSIRLLHRLLHSHWCTGPPADVASPRHWQLLLLELTRCSQCSSSAHSSTSSFILLWNHCFGPVCLRLHNVPLIAIMFEVGSWLLLENRQIVVHSFRVMLLVCLYLGFDLIEPDCCLARLQMNLWMYCTLGSTGSLFATSFVGLRCAQEMIIFPSLICVGNVIWTAMINALLMRIEEMLFYYYCDISFVFWEFHAVCLYKICRLPIPARRWVFHGIEFWNWYSHSWASWLCCIGAIVFLISLSSLEMRKKARPSSLVLLCIFSYLSSLLPELNPGLLLALADYLYVDWWTFLFIPRSYSITHHSCVVDLEFYAYESSSQARLWSVDWFHSSSAPSSLLWDLHPPKVLNRHQ